MIQSVNQVKPSFFFGSKLSNSNRHIFRTSFKISLKINFKAKYFKERRKPIIPLVWEDLHMSTDRRCWLANSCFSINLPPSFLMLSISGDGCWMMFRKSLWFTARVYQTIRTTPNQEKLSVFRRSWVLINQYIQKMSENVKELRFHFIVCLHGIIIMYQNSITSTWYLGRNGQKAADRTRDVYLYHSWCLAMCFWRLKKG